MKPNFCVVTTTYQRPEKILRCVQSVQAQAFTNWIQIIVIDDPISAYDRLHTLSKDDTRLITLVNKTNLGKNASVNKALAYLLNIKFDGYVIYLDDDDRLAISCMQDFANKIAEDGKKWLVSQRVSSTTDVPYTINLTGKNVISYTMDSLLKKTFRGDATHCIDFASVSNIIFSTQIKNAEEWLYFAQVSTRIPKFNYYEVAGTYSEGYSLDGLTNKYHQDAQYRKNTLVLWKEILREGKGSFTIYFYMLLRSIRALRK